MQGISNCVWSLSEHGPLSERIINLVDKKSKWLLSQNNLVAVAMVARSLAKHRIHSYVLLILLKDRIA